MTLEAYAKKAFVNPWVGLDWRACAKSSGTWLLDATSAYATTDVMWSFSGIQQILRRGDTFEFPSKISASQLRLFLSERGYAPLCFVQDKGYDLRVYEGDIPLDSSALLVLSQELPILWMGGVHPMKGCLYMTSEGFVQTHETDALWTSFHAYPKSADKITTRIQGVTGWLDREGSPVEVLSQSEGVWTVRTSDAIIEAVTF